MEAEDLVELLEFSRKDIRKQLKKEEWEEFIQAYRGIVAELPQAPSQDDIERVTNAICDLLRRYSYTRGALLGWQGRMGPERMLPSSSQVVPPLGALRQLVNRLKAIALDDEKAPPRDSRPPGKPHLAEESKKDG